MRAAAVIRFLCTAILLVAAAPAVAQSGDNITQTILPDTTPLACEGNCPFIQPAVLTVPAIMQYPHDMAASGAEAVVDLSTTIGTEGRAGGILIANLVGPKEFADAAEKALSEETFRPATVGGRAVPQNVRMRFIFHFPDSRGSRRPLFDVYNRFHALSDQGNSTAALNLLHATLARSDLNLYERCMFAYALAALLVRQNQTAGALDAIRDATVDGGHFLADDVHEAGLRLRVRLEARSGNIGDAFAAYDVLSRMVSIPTGDGDSVLIIDVHKLVEGPQMLPASGSIVSKDLPWHHILVRRTFAFDGIHGPLEKFDLRCDTHSLNAPVGNTSEYAVPSDWSGCRVYVSGAPGATFQFVELPPRGTTAATQKK